MIRWQMDWWNRLRQFIGLRPTEAEMARRRAFVDAGGNWPPLPMAVPPRKPWR